MDSRPDLDLEALRARLEARASALRLELLDDRDKLDEVRRDDAVSLDRKEEADRVIRAGLGDAEYERDLTESREVEDALRRLGDGRYGTCLDCGDPISSLRLSAVPWASRCLECQRKREGHSG